MKRTGMALRAVYFVLSVFICVATKAQTDTVFATEWATIDSLILKNDLTKTALARVNELSDQAYQRKLPVQAVRALIYRYSLEDRITTNDPAHTIRSLRSELNKTSDPIQKAVVYALLANQYASYGNTYRWQLLNRRNTAGYDKNDISTWAAQDIDTAIVFNFQRALKNARMLQQVNIAAWDAVLIQGNMRQLRPTLYDLLAHSALDQLIMADVYSPKAIQPFTIKDPRALLPADDFIVAGFAVKDSTDRSWQALELFRQLILFHRNDADKNALIDVDLKRIKWVYERAVLTGKDDLYRATLQKLTQQFPGTDASIGAWYQLANLEISKAAGYHPQGDTSNRYGYIKAEALIQEALCSFPATNSQVPQLQLLLHNIHTKQLFTETENVNLPGQPILATASYRNTDTLYGRLYRIPSMDDFYASNEAPDRYWKKIKKLPLVRSFIQPLPATNDRQTHSTYFKLDALPAGAYLLVSSSSDRFPDTTDRDISSIQQFYVSRISYVKNDKEVFVLDRQTGQPMPGTRVAVLKAQYNRELRKVIYDTAAIRVTDKNGHFQSPVTNSGIRFVLMSANDTLNIYRDDYVYSMSAEEDNKDYEKRNSTVYFFTDRSIYRPGQTVYFKGIAVTRDKNTHLSKIITENDADWVYLRDVNGKTIDSLSYTLNSFGSFAGSFKLPQSGLTGNFSIVVKRYNWSAQGFSVEEYKRPLFNVSFDKPKNSYRLNDTIVITGLAKAYSGNPVSNARVVYNVNRRGEYPIPYFRRIPMPFINAREIAHGEVLTDKDGRFTIRFPALPDDITDSSGNPFFSFAVTADVTDINGETRNASTQIKTGFQSLLLQLSTAALMEKDSLRSIGISSTNLSGEKQAAKVHVKIQTLIGPGRMIRPRLVSRPDQSTMTEAEFIRYFPHDEYRDETNPENWQTGRTVLEQEIDTKQEGQLKISPGILEAGYYQVEAVATDNYGKKVTTKTIMQLVDRRQLSIPVYDFSYAASNRTEPGEIATFLSGTSVENIFVITGVARQRQKTRTYDVSSRAAGITTLRYTPLESDRGGIEVSEAFVYNNRLYTHRYMVNVPWSNKVLDVHFASYRDKTEPGSKETWTVTVSGSKGDSTAAELLTGMYDASLDQFKPQGWSVPAIWNSDLRYSIFDGSVGFSVSQTFVTNGVEGWHGTIPNRQYDRMALSAEELMEERLRRSIEDPAISPSLRRKLRQTLMYIADQQAEIKGGILYREGQRKEISDVSAEYRLAASAPSLGNAITLRGNTSSTAVAPIYMVDGQIVSSLDGISTADIVSITVLKTTDARVKYGIEAPDGLIVVITRLNATPVQVRKDFNETAFFFPQLYADSTGRYSFSFTMPESLTQWKWMAFAHTKELAFGYHNTSIITQKKLMVQPNTPRFLREGDRVELSAKIVNMSEKELTGRLTLELFDATNNTPVDGWFNNLLPAQYFTVEAGQSTAVQFPVQIPFGFNKPLTWRMVARSAEISDGEENTLPVLSNRLLVTETLPLYLSNDTTQSFRFEKLRNNKSESLTHESITVEYTANPVWYAVQALPYLIEYPYECSEQTFNRFYANTLASYIVHRNPRLAQVFEQWKKDSTALLSNLQKNQDLKQLLLQETPWVLQAETEEQQKKNIALLFDLARLSSQTEQFIAKLEQLQLPDGSFSWFKGGRSDRYITNYILTGIGKLKKLGALTPDIALRIRNILMQALRYADKQIVEDYRRLKQSKVDLSLQHASNSQLDYLFMRSFFADIAPLSFEESAYYYGQTKKYWTSLNTYHKAQLGLIAYRNKEERFVNVNILPALLENSSTDTKLGIYWKQTYTCFWYQSPLEHQSMMIACFAEAGSGIGLYTQQLNQMKTWLLLNKQTNNWRTTVATADACYALLLNGGTWLDTEKQVVIRLGNYTAASNLQKTEAGPGYFKKRIDGKIVNEQMGDITVSVKSNDPKSSAPSWGSVYWRYFEDMDKISSAGSPLSLSKQLFIEKNSDKGKQLVPVKDGDELKVGDRIISRIVLRSDRDMDYLHLKDMRAASMEPVNVLSGYRWQDGLGYYESTKDVATDFFIDHLNKGTYVFDYPLFVTHTGVFSVGIATIENMYAPEFSSHSEGIKIRVGK